MTTPNKKKLPTINQPTLVVELPTSKQKVKYRPLVVREQQTLLLAQQSEDQESIYATIEDVMTSCTAGTIDLETVPLGDLAYLFLQIHIASNGSDITVGTTCENEECKHEILINLDLGQVTVSEAVDSMIKITDDVSIQFKYPTYADTIVLSNFKDRPVAGIYHLVDSIYDLDGVYTKADYSVEEFEEWFAGMTDVQLNAIYNFVDSIPDLFYDLKYSCPKCKTQHSKRVEGLQSFFRLSYEHSVSGRLLQDECDPEDGVSDVNNGVRSDDSV